LKEYLTVEILQQQGTLFAQGFKMPKHNI
jgi:hypothetical protein